jgi:hypothetical protein
VKHAQYEIFWFAHHFFIVFYVCMVFHGPVFVYWVILPVVLYVLERVWRIKRSQRTIYLKSIKWIPPVLELNFCPKYKEDLDFVEGQYIYLNCPFLSANEVSVGVGRSYCEYCTGRSQILFDRCLCQAFTVTHAHTYTHTCTPIHILCT